MHLRNLEDLFYIDKVLEEGGVFLWRRRHSEPSTDTCINPYIVLNVRVGFGKFQQIAVARWAWMVQWILLSTLSVGRGHIQVSPTHRDFLRLDLSGELRMRWIAGSKAVASTPCATLLLKPRRHFYFHERSYPTIPLLLSHSAKVACLLLHLHIP